MSDVRVWQGRIDLHKGFLRDPVRNTAYRAAIERNVRRGARVLDIGTGTGIWACVAARAGAEHVVAVDFSDFADHARRTVERNGFADRIEVIKTDILTLELDGRFEARGDLEIEPRERRISRRSARGVRDKRVRRPRRDTSSESP